MASKKAKTPKPAKVPRDPNAGVAAAFLALPGAAAAVAAGVKLRLQKDEQNPSGFDPLVSRFLPPVGFDPATGRPFYHVPDEHVAPGDRSNHSRLAYRAYADVKYGYLHAGTFPKWVWYAIGATGVSLGLALALRHKPQLIKLVKAAK